MCQFQTNCCASESKGKCKSTQWGCSINCHIICRTAISELPKKNLGQPDSTAVSTLSNYCELIVINCVMQCYRWVWSKEESLSTASSKGQHHLLEQNWATSEEFLSDSHRFKSDSWRWSFSYGAHIALLTLCAGTSIKIDLKWIHIGLKNFHWVPRLHIQTGFIKGTVCMSYFLFFKILQDCRIVEVEGYFWRSMSPATILRTKSVIARCLGP